jgi:hypothetical protein
VAAFGGGIVTDASSFDEISRTLHVLDGQILTSFDIRENAETILRFDLGAEVALWPGDNGEVWTLYEDEVVATTLHADGSFSTEKLGQGD